MDNTHEAISPAEQFELVRRILETETRRPNNAETVALFAGFLYCGDCGSRLVRRSASYKGKRYIYYQCSGSKQNKGSCTSHNLQDEKLYNIVRNALQMQIQIVMEEAEFVESIRQAQQEPYRVRRIERQIRQLTAEQAHTPVSYTHLAVYKRQALSVSAISFSSFLGHSCRSGRNLLWNKIIFR